MNGDVTLEASRQCQRACKTILSFRHYYMYLYYSIILLFHQDGQNKLQRFLLFFQ